VIDEATKVKTPLVESIIGVQYLTNKQKLGKGRGNLVTLVSIINLLECSRRWPIGSQKTSELAVLSHEHHCKYCRRQSKKILKKLNVRNTV